MKVKGKLKKEVLARMRRNLLLEYKLEKVYLQRKIAYMKQCQKEDKSTGIVLDPDAPVEPYSIFPK